MLLEYVVQSRRYGYTYVRVADRDDTYGTIQGLPVRMYWTQYGRSFQGGGHKYKAYLDYVDTGRPVPSRLFSKFIED